VSGCQLAYAPAVVNAQMRPGLHHGVFVHELVVVVFDEVVAESLRVDPQDRYG